MCSTVLLESTQKVDQRVFHEWEDLETALKFKMQNIRGIIQNPIKLTPADVVYWKKQVKEGKEEFNRAFNELVVRTLKTIVIGEDE